MHLHQTKLQATLNAYYTAREACRVGHHIDGSCTIIYRDRPIDFLTSREVWDKFMYIAETGGPIVLPPPGPCDPSSTF